jgi:hypothetical protein
MDDTNEHGLTPLSPLDGSMDPDGLMTRDVLDSALNAIYSSGFDLGVPDDLGSLYGAPDVHDVRPARDAGHRDRDRERIRRGFQPQARPRRDEQQTRPTRSASEGAPT